MAETSDATRITLPVNVWAQIVFAVQESRDARLVALKGGEGTMENTTRTVFRVSLHEAQTDKYGRFFECYADDEDHAVEQAEEAYPGCEILWVAVVDG